jgi:hypothetical protein
VIRGDLSKLLPFTLRGALGEANAGMQRASATIACRTVLDLRSPLDKYFSQTLLLAASWHRHCASDTRFEVQTVGGNNPVLDRFLDGIGARCMQIPPGPNDDFSKSSNKIEAAHADPAGGAVLLLDNDICLLAGLGELQQLSTAGIAASEAGTLRISDAQWQCILEDLGLPLLRRSFRAVNSRPALPDGQPDPENFLYLNSGVVLLPPGHDHRHAWQTLQRRIYEFFREHPLCSDAVAASDQAGFAASIAAHGRFTWLPIRFNYRHGCFRLGLEPAERIAIVHLTGDVPNSQALGMTQRIQAYWDRFILSKLANLPQSVPAAERSRRRDIAMSVLDAIQAIVRDYELERWLGEYRASSRGVPA